MLGHRTTPVRGVIANGADGGHDPGPESRLPAAGVNRLPLRDEGGPPHREGRRVSDLIPTSAIVERVLAELVGRAEEQRAG